MRIDKLELRNFRKFADVTIEFPRSAYGPPDTGSFHVLVGKNGSGKTSILDALAVALGVWLERVPDALLANSRRRLTPDQKRLVGNKAGDRVQFQEPGDETAILATGTILDQQNITWGQSLPAGKKNVSNRVSKQALAIIASAYERVQKGEPVLLPVIAYYGAGRTWLPHNQRKSLKAKSNGPASRWEAFYDCLNDRIRLSDLNTWFRGEAIARGNRGGSYRPGFEAVLRAVYRVVAGADGLEYDPDREEIILSIDGNSQPFSNLSAGQRSLFALTADIAIKMVTQNNFLVPADALTGEDASLPRVLAQTPGVVLIDELDVHLHPKWQRQIAADLKRAFPAVQFIVTTHSPQVIGEMQPDEVCLLRQDGIGETPSQSFGMDSNWILQVLMEAEELDTSVKHEVACVFDLLRLRRLGEAGEMIGALRSRIGNSETLQRAASTLERMRLLQQ